MDLVLQIAGFKFRSPQGLPHLLNGFDGPLVAGQGVLIFPPGGQHIADAPVRLPDDLGLLYLAADRQAGFVIGHSNPEHAAV